ncbi:MAG: DUF1045 domain-containing protein [Pseudomonadota bacterium]
MTDHTRYALFYVPRAGSALAAFGAAWLGWDSAAGAEVAHPDCPGLDVAAVTARPRKYGFHGTLKPPFRLAEGQSADALREAARDLAAEIAAFDLPALRLSRLGRFLALVPSASSGALDAMAARVVTELDAFRAPPSAAELERRRASGLTEAEEANLTRWGYPYVLDQFRFHLTLTGALHPETIAATEAAVLPLTNPFRAAPQPMREIALCGEAAHDGRIRVLDRFPLRS